MENFIANAKWTFIDKDDFKYFFILLLDRFFIVLMVDTWFQTFHKIYNEFTIFLILSYS